MKKLITSIALIFGSIAASGQQDPQFTQFMHNKLFMNPAYAGMKGALCFSTIGRQQWAGFDGSPRSGIFSADFASPVLHGGIGINMLYDELGFESNMNYDFNYSYHIEKICDGTLGIGIDAGIFSKRVGPTGSQSWVATTNWQTDGSIPPQLKKYIFDYGAGIWYERKNLWFGISSSHLNAKLIDAGMSGVHQLKYQMARHYFITGGYIFQQGSWQFQPSFLVKSDATITSAEINMNALFNQRFWFGMSYRVKDAICPMIGFQWTNDKPAVYAEATDNAPPVLIQKARPGNTMKIGFAYDYTTSNLKNYNSGTFEIFLNYCIPVSRTVPTTKVLDTRQGNW